jgi:uncharacterized protein (DUF302 family)
MRTTNHINVEHVVVQSNRGYEEVKATLEERMGMLGNTDELARQLTAMKAPWGQIAKAIEERMGSSGFTVFSKIEQGQILSLAGKSRKVIQYAVGNPLLAIQMIEHVPEVALYAPLRLTVYEGHNGKTLVAFDRLTSLLVQYRHPEVARVAEVVEQKLEALVAEATGTEARVQVPAD